MSLKPELLSRRLAVYLLNKQQQLDLNLPEISSSGHLRLAPKVSESPETPRLKFGHLDKACYKKLFFR